MTDDRRDRLAGVLLGTALGDALGLATEGMSPRAIARRFGRVERFRLAGAVGFVSDDTEQSALVAGCLARHPRDAGACAKALRGALLRWFLRLPWGIGLATLRACVRIALGLARSGVRSAGNGAAMRAAVVGAFFHDDAPRRRAFSDALAEVTHTDPRAVEGARYVAELAAAAVAEDDVEPSPARCFERARAAVTEPSLGAALDRARDLVLAEVSVAEAARQLGTTGFVLHTLAFATYAFLRFGRDPASALTEVVNAGGDTDSIGAIVGAWVGALHGGAALPRELVARLHDGPFGPTHLRALAADLARARHGAAPVARYSALYALARNLALYPVVLFHGFRRLVPW